MVMLLQQSERFLVERYKRVRSLGKWCWVTVGYFNAATSEEARKKGRDAIADKMCILRAKKVGSN
jgi:hypothetical protein